MSRFWAEWEAGGHIAPGDWAFAPDAREGSVQKRDVGLSSSELTTYRRRHGDALCLGQEGVFVV